MKEIRELFFSSLKEAAVITGIIFLLMIIVEAFVLRYKEKIVRFSQKNRFLQYFVSSFFGIIPGCVGTFAMDSLYMAGLLGFGGIVAVMVATSGDEAFLLISMAVKGTIPWIVLGALMATLFFLGIFSGYLADFFKEKSKMRFCGRCSIEYHKHKESSLRHFLKNHVYKHILKKHIWQIFLWIFAALFIIGFFEGDVSLALNGAGMFYVLVAASLVGLLPISGPNVFLVVMFSKGMVPFSVMLANSIIQDGHGLLPIMGFSIEDALKIKLFNFVIGFLIGVLLLLAGL